MCGGGGGVDVLYVIVISWEGVLYVEGWGRENNTA